jgi:hypothetical protein
MTLSGGIRRGSAEERRFPVEEFAVPFAKPVNRYLKGPSDVFIRASVEHDASAWTRSSSSPAEGAGYIQEGPFESLSRSNRSLALFAQSHAALG